MLRTLAHVVIRIHPYVLANYRLESYDRLRYTPGPTIKSLALMNSASYRHERGTDVVVFTLKMAS